MVVGLLRLLVPILLILGTLYIAYRMYHRFLRYRERKQDREHERRLARERRDYDMLMESLEYDEIERELAKEREKNNTESTRERSEQNN